MDALKNELKNATEQIQKKSVLTTDDMETMLLALLMEEDGNEFTKN